MGQKQSSLEKQKSVQKLIKVDQNKPNPVPKRPKMPTTKIVSHQGTYEWRIQNWNNLMESGQKEILSTLRIYYEDRGQWSGIAHTFRIICQPDYKDDGSIASLSFKLKSILDKSEHRLLRKNFEREKKTYYQSKETEGSYRIECSQPGVQMEIINKANGEVIPNISPSGLSKNCSISDSENMVFRFSGKLPKDFEITTHVKILVEYDF